jgi:hypothetical protein
VALPWKLEDGIAGENAVGTDYNQEYGVDDFRYIWEQSGCNADDVKMCGANDGSAFAGDILPVLARFKFGREARVSPQLMPT